MLAISHKHKIVAVPTSESALNIFPDAKPVNLHGLPHLAVTHGIAETYLLRRMGFDVPSPILTHYDWCGGKPFDVQKKTCAMLSMNERAFVLNGMGTGKTKAALWAWHYLRSNGQAKKLLVIAPLSTLTFTWAKEIFSTLPGIQWEVLHGTKARRLQRLSNSEAEIYIVNHDGLKVIIDEVIANEDIDTVVIDELATYRNGQSQRTKTARKLAQAKRRVWGMTGSPIPNEPTDSWAQVTIIKPENVPRYFGRFRDQLMHRISAFKWAPKQDAVDQAFGVMQPAVRFTLDDVVELPDVIERTIEVELGDKQAKVYKSLADTCFAAVQSQEITAANAGVVMSKLLQVACGWVYATDKGVVPLDNEKRIATLLDTVTSCERKVLVFVPFKHALSGIGAALKHEGIEYAEVSGDTPASVRNEIFNLFQNTQKFKVLIAHPQCLAHGITLTAADTVIWFAPVTSLEIYDQANHRIRRVGQKAKQQIIHLEGTRVERRIYALLRGKQRVQEKFLELFEEATKDDVNIHR
jgi:SNF2 family DNA or RNA helicase